MCLKHNNLLGGIVLSVLLGQGEFKYKVVEDWAILPENWSFMDVAGVAVNSKDEVYVFNRGKHPMIIFDIDGNFLRSWGEKLFSRPSFELSLTDSERDLKYSFS